MKKEDPDLIILPLRMESENAKPSLLEQLQIAEYAAIQELTMRTAKKGQAIMCSGANLIVRREVWLECENELHPEIPSGDDMFLLEAVKRKGYTVGVIDEEEYTAYILDVGLTAIPLETIIAPYLTGETAELGPCRQQWNFLHIKDCGRAVLALAELAVSAASAPELRERAVSNAEQSAETARTSRSSHVYNIGGDDTRPLKDFVQEVFDIALSCGYDRAGFHLAERPAGPEGTPYLCPDISKIREMAGWSPQITFRDGIREMLLQ